MTKVTNRDKLLEEGLKVVHAQGFAGASVRDIVQAAGVPQGSFTNHFASKEAFGLEVLEIYFAGTLATIDRTLRNEAMAPLRRLRAYIDANIAEIKQCDMNNGCLFGTLSAEAWEQSHSIRDRVVEIFDHIQREIGECLKAAVEAGEISPKTNRTAMAGFILTSLQGAILLSKVRRSALPVERFKQMLFLTVLR